MPHSRILDSSSSLTSPRRATGFIVALLAALALVLGGVLVPALTAGAAPVTGSIFAAKTPVGLLSHDDKDAVEVGTRFRVVQAGKATGMTFWKTEENVGTHVGTLWSSSGKALATVTFASETKSGWQTATFSAPVDLAAGASYTVSYRAPKGQYAVTQFSKATSSSPAISLGADAGVYRYGSGKAVPTDTYRSSQYWVDVIFAPRSSTTPPAAVTPSPRPKPPGPQLPTPTATANPPAPKPTTTPTPTPTPTNPTPPSGHPTAATTGVPAGTTLSTYTGPCTITAAGTVIDAKTINCNLSIRAKGVVISRSIVNGEVYGGTDGSTSFTIRDSEVRIGARMGTGIGDGYFTAQRVEVTGGNRSINCFLNCTVEASYVHGQFRDASGAAHESGIRMGSGSTIRGNTISCDAPDVPPDAGCSAALTGYGDFAIVQKNTIEGNLFLATTGGYCAYGGSTQGKPYSAGVNGIRFVDNVFQRGARGKCGYYGAITSFDASAPGNVWSGNTWDDGTVLRSAN